MNISRFIAKNSSRKLHLWIEKKKKDNLSIKCSFSLVIRVFSVRLIRLMATGISTKWVNLFEKLKNSFCFLLPTQSIDFFHLIIHCMSKIQYPSISFIDLTSFFSAYKLSRFRAWLDQHIHCLWWIPEDIRFIYSLCFREQFQDVEFGFSSMYKDAKWAFSLFWYIWHESFVFRNELLVYWKNFHSIH